MALPFQRLRDYPLLTAESYEVTSAKDKSYNCVAWALGADDDWIDHSGMTGTTWPAGIDDSGSVASWIALFAREGYSACDSDEAEQGFEKVAIYANGEEATHVSRQLDGNKWRWASKLGGLEDIEHLALANLECATYGAVARILRRAQPD